MSEHNFGSELTSLGLPATLDAKTLAATVLKKNRRRIRMLSALTIGLWIMTFLLVPSLWMPFAAKMNEQTKLLLTPNRQPLPVTTETLTRILGEVTVHVSMVSGYILGIITLASLLAAISTVWLVLTVRRVTLEQLSAGLALISEQLRRLEQKT
jgi:hypothetical protein